MEENTYSNIIAPSDGVRRFLSKGIVLMMSFVAALYGVVGFRMNLLEYNVLGGSLRSRVLFAAYVIFPLGLFAAYVFSRIKKCGLAFGMISLIVAAVGCSMLLLNSLSALLMGGGIQSIIGGVFELLAFGMMLVVLGNLIMSCINCRIIPELGIAGIAAAVVATIMVVVMLANSYSVMQFAWNEAFDWSYLPEQVSENGFESEATWIFRNIPLSSSAAEIMFTRRLLERIGACLLYICFAALCMRYRREMVEFNKLLEHAGEYVDVPQAHIAESLAEHERIIQSKLQASTRSVKERLQAAQDKMNERKEEKERKKAEAERQEQQLNLDGTEYSSYGSEEEYSDYGDYDYAAPPPRRRQLTDEEREGANRYANRRAEREYYGDEQAPERPRRRQLTDEEREGANRYANRRAEREYYDDGQAPERPRRRQLTDEEREARARRRAEREYYDDGQAPERPRRRQLTDEERDYYGDEQAPERPRRRQLTDEEREARARRRAEREYYGDEQAPERRRQLTNEEREARARRRAEREYYGDEQAPERRRQLTDEEREARANHHANRRAEPDDGLTDEERYLMQERRKYNPDYDREQERQRRAMRKNSEYLERTVAKDRIDSDGGTQQNLSDYYRNYMSRQRSGGKRQDGDEPDLR